MSDLNQCQFIGRLGKDPEIRYAPSGDAVANFSVASSQKWKDKNGEKQEKTEWVRLVAFGKLAEIVGEYLKKGAQVYVSGRMQTRKYTDKDGVERYTTEVVLDQMQMLGSKRTEGEQSSTPQAATTQATVDTRGGGARGRTEDFDDDSDIPF